MEAVKKHGIALKYASEELRNDKEVVMVAVKEDRRALKYLSEELRNDKEFILSCSENLDRESDTYLDKESDYEQIEKNSNGDGILVQDNNDISIEEQLVEEIKSKQGVLKNKKQELINIMEKLKLEIKNRHKE